MRHRRVYANLAVFAAVSVLMAAWAARSILTVDAVSHPYVLSARFPDASGVGPDAEVTYLGVTAGSVSSVRREADRHDVLVTMHLRRSVRVPQRSTARILRKSAIGEPYVDLSAPPGVTGGTGAGPWYRSGAMVPAAGTSTPVELAGLLRSAGTLVGAIDPADVQTLLHEAALSLDGRTDSLRQLAEAGDRLTAALAQRTAAIDRLATDGTRLTHVLSDHRDDLGASLTDLRLVAGTLRDARGDIGVVLDRGSALAGRGADIVSHQKTDLDCDLQVLGVLTGETASDLRRRQLAALLDLGPAAFGGVWDSRDVEPDGVWIRVGLIVNPSYHPARQFVPPRPVPAARTVPACRSGLRPVVGADYAAGRRAALPLSVPPATRTGLLALGLAGAAAAAVLGPLTRRDLRPAWAPGDPA